MSWTKKRDKIAMRLKRFIYTTMHPNIFHGHEASPPFFEGWYFKLISAGQDSRFALIPGVFLGENGHAFVQVLDGLSRKATYHVYPLEEFWASKDRFQVRIGPNSFSADCLSVDIDRPEGSLHGELHFDGLTPWPISISSPGIMGWYAWVPRMECYHGVVSLDHGIRGELEVDGRAVDFTGGKGYIEKDWGESFPAAWVWFQTNHFQEPGTSLTASVAIIPWMRTSFRGFIIGLWHAGHLYRFATYTGARIEHLAIKGDHVEWIVKGNAGRLEMRARRAGTALLKGPTRSDMGLRVPETLDGEVEVRLRSPTGKEIYSGHGRHAGLEVGGDVDKLLKG
jgi:tocopherol cyclase